MHDRGCWRPVLIGLAIALSLSSGCARVDSEPGACPPVVAYPAEFQARGSTEIEALLPPGTAIETMLADYHVMRQQAAACVVPRPTR